MRTEIKYRLGFMPSQKHLLGQMKPNRIINDSVGEFLTSVDDPETRERFFATNERNGYHPAFFELFFRSEAAEMFEATMFQIVFGRNFIELTYDEKTQYDESNLCPHCGAGRIQQEPLVIPPLGKRRVPPLFLIAGGQYLCTKPFALQIGLIAPGVRFTPVFSSRKHLDSLEAKGVDLTPASEICKWVEEPGVVAFQLEAERLVDLSDRTTAGINPYRVGENPYPCPLGHIFGYRQLSPLVLISVPSSFNFAMSKQLWGTHEKDSYYWPMRKLLASQALGQLILAAKIKYIQVVPVYSEAGTII